MALKSTYLIEKRNDLNEMRSNGMTLQELRFFSIYLAKINARDRSTRRITFTLTEFKRIMDFQGHDNISYLKSVTNKILSKVINVPNDKKGYTAFTLFKECEVFQDSNTGEWFITIDASDKALDLMFEFKQKYFSYELWNALQLNSSNQLRMYEILKQYESVHERIISVIKLRELLGIQPNEYARFGDFKCRVLEPCKEALKLYTDIQYTYEPYGKKGPGGKIINLKFAIYKNTDYVDRISLEQFLSFGELHSSIIACNADMQEIENNSTLSFYSGCCNNEFSVDELNWIISALCEVIPSHGESKDEILTKRYNYLTRKYTELIIRNKKKPFIKRRFAYLKKIISADFQKAE
jgi:plasmid replication initiation protein